MKRKKMRINPRYQFFSLKNLLLISGFVTHFWIYKKIEMGFY